MKKYMQSMAVVGVLAAGAGGFALLHATRPEPEPSGEGPRPLTMFVEPVRAHPVALNVYTQGEVRARAEMDVVAEVSGRVLSVAREFVPGGNIAPGEVLLTIDDTDYRFAVVRAEAGVAEAVMKVEQIKADAAVARKQLAQIRATPLGLREPQIADAQARLRAAQADLAEARLDLERTRVRLPFQGRLRETYVNAGQFVTMGTPLGRAFATDIAEVRMPLSDAQLASLNLPIGYVAAPGEGASVDFSAVVAGRERHWTGRLTRLDAAMDPQTRLIHAVAEVNEPYGAGASAAAGMPFAVGLFVDASIQGRKLASARVIPRVALRSADEVYVIRDGLLDIRTVRVIHRSAEEVVVSGGVEVGEQIVVSQVRSPVEGMRVQAATHEVLASDSAQRPNPADDPA